MALFICQLWFNGDQGCLFLFCRDIWTSLCWALCQTSKSSLQELLLEFQSPVFFTIISGDFVCNLFFGAGVFCNLFLVQVF